MKSKYDSPPKGVPKEVWDEFSKSLDEYIAQWTEDVTRRLQAQKRATRKQRKANT